MDVLTALWIAVPVAAMVSASVFDVRTREAPDVCWATVCVAGPVLLAIQDPNAVSALYLLGVMLLAAYMLSPRLVGVPGAAVTMASAVSFAVGFAVDPGGNLATAGLTVPVMFTVFLGMYRVGLIPGGADAKCLMSVAMAFPLYPSGGLPLLWQPVYPDAFVMNPSVSVLVLALVMTLAWAVRALALNIRNRDLGRWMLTSYRLELDDVDGTFVRPVERMVDGRLMHKGTCGQDEVGDVLDGLRAAGVGTVRVTPMVPFVLPMTVATVVVMVVGSPLSVI